MVPGLVMILPLATGCGSERAGGGSGAKASGGASSAGATVSPTPATRLDISVKASKQAQAKQWTLTCDPVGGTHPEADKACVALSKAKTDWFAPVAKDAVCTEIYGGPEEATVKGVWRGKQIDATFKRNNGCELTRWTNVGALFGQLPPVR